MAQQPNHNIVSQSTLTTEQLAHCNVSASSYCSPGLPVSRLVYWALLFCKLDRLAVVPAL
eukprot:scaffold2045_cov404-Prasinococcus_capsulatus_cf.AAC.31